MGYTVFARKYRPQSFKDLVGQEHVAQALQNALKSDRLAHAFLFTGARGVGKTTAARLLAKALNCEQGPAPEPCNLCASCTSIRAGNDLDVLEIDGASNNSVEDVRRLQESIPFRPSHSRFKVYIVDEVHMLSSGAFNAFLKTLEEPPAHAKFIFATTELHKVPITVRSRCQRYDFRLINQQRIAERLQHVLSEEQQSFEPEACARIAQEAAGSLRDALTLLDQLCAFSDGTLTLHEVENALGLAPRAVLLGLVDALVQRDAAALLRTLAQGDEAGVEPTVVLRQLLEALRDLAVVHAAAGESSLARNLSAEELGPRLAQLGARGALEVQRLFALVSELYDRVAQSRFPRLQLEVGLLRGVEQTPLVQVEALIASLEGKALPETPLPRPRTQGQLPPPATPSVRELAPSAPPAAPMASTESAAPAPPAKSLPAPVVAMEPELEQSAATPAPSAAAPADLEPEPEPEPELGSVPAPAPAPQVLPAQRSDDPWADVIDELQARRPALAAVLEHAAPLEVSAEKLVLRFAGGAFFAEQAKAPAARQDLQDALERRLGSRPKLDIGVGSAPEGHATYVDRKKQALASAREALEREALGSPAVQAALEVFPEAEPKVIVDEARVKAAVMPVAENA